MAKKGIKQNREHIDKRIASLKSNYKKENHPNFGKHLSITTRNKISNAITGTKHSNDFKEKCRKNNLGKKYSHEINAKKGRPSKRKGLHEHDRNEMIECACGCGQLRKKYVHKRGNRISRFIQGHQGGIGWNKLNQIEKERRKIFLSNLQKGRNSSKKNKTWEEFYGEDKAKEIKVKTKLARAKQIFPMKDTSIEVKIQNFLKELNIQFFTHQYISEITHAYQCDILINPQPNFMSEKKTIIEVDGDYWHGNPFIYLNPNKMQKEKLEKDSCRNEELREAGFEVIRLWENEIKKMHLEDFTILLNLYKHKIVEKLG